MRHGTFLSEEKSRHEEILRNSVLPWGDIHLSLNERIEITFTNHGNGPLIVEDIRLTRNGVELESFFELGKINPFNGRTQENIKLRSYQLPKGDSTTLSRDGQMNLLQITSPDLLTNLVVQNHFNTYLSVLGEMEISITYRDIYGKSETKKWSLIQWKSLGGYFFNIS